MGHHHDVGDGHDHHHDGGWRGFFKDLQGHSHDVKADSWPKVVKILVAMALNGSLGAWQIYSLSQEANSAGIFVDGIHNASDMFSLSVPLVTMALTARALRRGKLNDSIVPTLLTFINYIALAAFMISAAIFASLRLAFDGVESSGDLMSTAGIVSLIVNVATVLLLYEKNSNDEAMESALAHQVSDLFSSIGVLLGGKLVEATGWRGVDPLLTIGISALILWMIYKKTLKTGSEVLQWMKNRSVEQST